MPEDEILWSIQEAGQNIIADAGYHQYEISAYSQTAFQCEHNRNYWKFGDYIGIGAGAHSKLTDVATNRIIRKWKIKHPKQYLASEECTAGEREIAITDLPLEFMLNALRLYQAIPFSLFEERTGLKINRIEKQLAQAKREGFLDINHQSISTTSLGKHFLNDLLQIFDPSNN